MTSSGWHKSAGIIGLLLGRKRLPRQELEAQRKAQPVRMAAAVAGH